MTAAASLKSPLSEEYDIAALEPVKLSRANLPKLGGLGYNPRHLREGIVHIGVGNFNRAHLLMYLHRLMQKGEAHDWAVCGVGLLPSDTAMRDALARQDNLYTVIERDAHGDKTHIVGAMTSYLHGPSDPQAVVDKLADPSTRIVSLTVTEGGYYRSESTGGLEFANPAVIKALANTGHPVIWPDYIRAAARKRRDVGAGGLTVWSCDNVQENGDLSREIVLSFIGATDPKLRAWAANNVSFPNSMVDRITPRTTQQIKDLVARQHGIEDNWPVPTETFTQFVVEDDFKSGRPALEHVGVQMVHDVKPYEMMKLRLLNGSHVLIGSLGAVAGYHFVHEVMADKQFVQVIRRYMNEVMPQIPPMEGVDLLVYCDTLVERFANPSIQDSLARISYDGSSKLPKFILGAVREQLATGGPIELLSLVVASWCRSLTGKNDAGQRIAVDDPRAANLKSLADPADPTALLNYRDVFGDDLGQSKRFVAAVSKALASLYESGAKATIARYAIKAGAD